MEIGPLGWVLGVGLRTPIRNKLPLMKPKMWYRTYGFRGGPLWRRRLALDCSANVEVGDIFKDLQITRY